MSERTKRSRAGDVAESIEGRGLVPDGTDVVWCSRNHGVVHVRAQPRTGGVERVADVQRGQRPVGIPAETAGIGPPFDGGSGGSHVRRWDKGQISPTCFPPLQLSIPPYLACFRQI